MVAKSRNRTNYALTPEALDALTKFKSMGINKDIAISFSVEMISKEPDKFLQYYQKRVTESFLNEDSGKNAD